MANSARETAGPSWSALVAILLGFPVALVYGTPLIPEVSGFLGGERGLWRVYWSIGAAGEWAFLVLALVFLAGARRPLSELGLTLPRWSTALILAALVALALAAAVRLPGMSAERLGHIPYGATMFIPPATVEDRLFWVFVSATAAICEEAMFRGIAIGELRRAGMPALVAALISCAAFAFFHGGLQQGAILFAIRFAVGLVLSLIYLRVNSVWPVVALHFGMDASVLAAS